MGSKLCSLCEVITTYVHDGDCLALGGFTSGRKPYAAVHEILRQGKKNFIGIGGPAAGDWDLLIGENRVSVFLNCYIANPGFSNVSRRFREFAEEGKLILEDYSQDVMMMMIHAASLGLPFLPLSYLMMGSDLTQKWGISKEIREGIDKISNDKFVYMPNPFNAKEKVICVPVPKIDTAIIHVQKASPDGTCRIEGDEFGDVDLAIAARHCIVTCEEIVTNEEIRKDGSQNTIPRFVPSAIVHAPYGAHPAQCYNYYDYDKEYFLEYDAASKTKEYFNKFLDKYVYSVKSHKEYLEMLGFNRLHNLNVVPGLGYSANFNEGD